MSQVVDRAIPVAVTPPAGRKAKRTGKSGKIGFPTYLLLSLAVLASVFPLYYMFVIASVGAQAVTSSPPRLYPGFNFGTIAAKVFEIVPFVQSLINSVIVSLSIAVLAAILSALAGFAFA